MTVISAAGGPSTISQAITIILGLMFVSFTTFGIFEYVTSKVKLSDSAQAVFGLVLFFVVVALLFVYQGGQQAIIDKSSGGP